MINVERGTDTSDDGSIDTLKFEQDVTLDQLGNWRAFDQDNNGDSTPDLAQTRAQNEVNETGTIAATTGINEVARERRKAA